MSAMFNRYGSWYMPHPSIVAALFLVAAIAACQEAGQEQLRHWTPTPTVLPTATSTEVPTATATSPRPLATATATEAPALAAVRDGLWNCREAAGIGSEILLVLGGGQEVESLMASADLSWRLVRISGVTCWVVADALE